MSYPITDFLKGLEAFAKGNSESSSYIKGIGKENVKSTLSRLDSTKRDPDGILWKPLAPVTIAKKGHSSILIDTRTMRGQVKNGDVIVKDGKIMIGTGVKVPYGITHQQPGGRSRYNNVPRRPFLGYAQVEIEKSINKLMDAFKEL